MQLTIMGEKINITSEEYKKEIHKAFNEMEAIEVTKLYLHMMVLEDEEDELIDGYDSGWKKQKDTNKDMTEHLLNIWRNKIRLNHIKERILIINLNINNEECDGDSYTSESVCEMDMVEQQMNSITI
jgi:hypothetical protein